MQRQQQHLDALVNLNRLTKLAKQAQAKSLYLCHVFRLKAVIHLHVLALWECRGVSVG